MYCKNSQVRNPSNFSGHSTNVSNNLFWTNKGKSKFMTGIPKPSIYGSEEYVRNNRNIVHFWGSLHLATVSSPHMVEIKDFNSASYVLTTNFPQGSQGSQILSLFLVLILEPYKNSREMRKYSQAKVISPHPIRAVPYYCHTHKLMSNN